MNYAQLRTRSPEQRLSTMLRNICWSIVACALCAIVVPVEARTYEEVYTAKAKQAYYNDPNVWVYTTKFAERFGMPDEWIDDDLKGAYAVAWRVENFPDVRTYFPHKGPDVSMPLRRCYFDVYVASDARIPWKDDHPAGQRYFTPQSPRYLAPQREEDAKKDRSPIGIESPGKTARIGLIAFGTVKEDLGGLQLTEFEKDIYQGITYVQLIHSCTNPPAINTYIEFWADKVWDGKNQSVLHRIDIPASFMKRLYTDWYERTGRNSAGEWGDVLKHKSKSPSKVEAHPDHPENYMEE